jgi:lipopolysaccharide/colanic/teichoic acid biosynthesis glycosyltransferase
MLSDFQSSFTAARERDARLPEHLTTRFAATLAAGDVGIVLFIAMVIFGGASNATVAAIVTTALICTLFWWCGLYKRSYAVFPRDEAYYACTAVLFAAIPTGLIVGGVGQIDAGLVAATLFFSALATSGWHIGIHLQRRGVTSPLAGRSSITPSAWHARESVRYLIPKRAFDLVVASVALLIASPIMLLAALAIVAETGQPVLFRQERVGRDGGRFDVLKFRTMRRDAGKEWARPGDTRITRVGAFLRRTSIDELPQLFNVLKGEMSIVGPRPEMVEFAERFAREMPAYDQRHVVAPGITGWAQVYHKRNLAPDEIGQIMPYDLFYVERASVVLDGAIVLKTIAEVLFHSAV